LEEWISEDTSGDYRDFLLLLASANREPNSTPISEERVKEDVSKLYRAGEGTLGTDEKVFIDIFAKRSWRHLRRVSEQYTTEYSHSLHTAIKKEFSGKLYDALRWTLEFVENRPAFFAHRIHTARHSVGVDEKTLIRVIISRKDVDLYEIAEEYNKQYHKSLKEELNLKNDFGNYLVAIVSSDRMK